MQQLADGVWIDQAPIGIVGMQLTSTMTVLRLSGNALLVHSPVALTPERQAAVDALGTVRHLVAPNTFHHLQLSAWASAYPDATVNGPAEVAKKHPDLDVQQTASAAPLAFADLVDALPIEGFRMRETVLFHRPSETLVVADLVHNIGRPSQAWTKIYAGMMGFYGRVALSRVIRWTAFPDRSAARASVDQVLTLPTRRIVVGHGAPIVDRPREALREAYAWLRG